MSNVRPEVTRLAQWAPLPHAEDDWAEGDLDRFAQDIGAVQPPISTDERLALMPLLDMPTEDDAFGVTLGVLHLIESAPHPPMWWRELDESKPWFATLKVRGLNYERLHPQTDPAPLAFPSE